MEDAGAVGRLGRGGVRHVVLLAALLAGLPLMLFFGLWVFRVQREPTVDLSPTASWAPMADPAQPDGNSLRFTVATMWSVESTFSLYRELIEEIARRAGRDESFVVRASYGELRRSLERDEIDVAFVCTGPYVVAVPSGRIKLLVEPVFKPGLVYRSVILVPRDSPRASLLGLRGARMAFSDAESFTGYFVPCTALYDQKVDLAGFFAKTIFSGSHEQSVQAVATGVADAAAVHSIVWHSAKTEDPSLALRLKEIWQSPAFGPPPVVVSTTMSPESEEALRQAFLALHEDEGCRKLMASLGIERFVAADDKHYRSAAELVRRFQSAPEIRSWY